MADLRKCIGSAKFGIEAHQAPVGDFPRQPSQKDGLGRMCRAHWNEYTTALRKAALARKEVVRAVVDAIDEKTRADPIAAPVSLNDKRRAKRARHTPTVGEVGHEPPTA